MLIYCNDRGKNFSSVVVESVQQHMVDKCHCRIFFEEDAALEYAEFFDKAPSNAGTEEVSSDNQAHVSIESFGVEERWTAEWNSSAEEHCLDH